MFWQVLSPLLGVAFGLFAGATLAGQALSITSKSHPSQADREELQWQLKAVQEGRTIQVCKVYRP